MKPTFYGRRPRATQATRRCAYNFFETLRPRRSQSAVFCTCAYERSFFYPLPPNPVNRVTTHTVEGYVPTV